MIWFFFIFGLAFADKLDRTYLPPPGSKYSGGSPGAIEAPLEHPKLHSSAKNEYLIPEIAIGIDRVAPKRPITQDTYSSTTNPPGNSFTASTTINPYPKNTGFSSENVYSTVSPVYHSSNYSDNFQNPDIAKNFYPNQFQRTSEFNENQFPTENYPQLIQGDVPISDITRNNFVNGIFNQSLPYSIKDSIVNDFSHKTSPSPQLVSDFIHSKYSPGQYFSSSIPTIDANTNLISSTLSPSIVNEYGTTVGPKQFYSSTSKLPQFSTITPIGSKISPFFNYANIKRPERIQAQADREAAILNYESSISPEGYAYSYDTSNGIHGDESGVTVNGVKAKGSYSYVGDDGKLYSVVYTADENGFQPRGDHLPTSPPIPDAILKVIEQVSKEKEAGIIDDGSYDEKKYGYRRYHNGYYSPKYDFSKVHSGIDKDGTLIKNTKNIFPTYNGAIRNQMTKNNQESNTYQDTIKNKDIPVINSYTNTRNNLENFDSQFPQKPNEFHKKSGIEHVGPYATTDLKTGYNVNSESPSRLFNQTYINSIIDNDRRQLVDKQTPLDNVGKYNDFIKGFTKENKPDDDIDENSYIETGYQYNPPQYTGKNEFPPRISDIYIKQTETLKQENSNKITPKPFLTPYASDTNDGQRKYDNNGRPIEDVESEYYDEELTQNNENYPSYFDSNLNRNDNYNKTISNNKPENDPIRKIYQSEGNKVGDHAPPTINKGYSYQQGVLDTDKESYTPFGVDRHSYISSTSTSTEAPTAFTSRINTSQPNDSKYTAGIPQTSSSPISIIPSSRYIPNVYQTNIQLNKTNTLPNYSTTRPGFISQYVGDIPTGTKLDYPTDLKNTRPGLEFSTNIPIIGNSYAPNLDITHNDEYNVHPTTSKIIGEDFRGPKQPQRFDPLTGYQY